LHYFRSTVLSLTEFLHKMYAAFVRSHVLFCSNTEVERVSCRWRTEATYDTFQQTLVRK